MRKQGNRQAMARNVFPFTPQRESEEKCVDANGRICKNNSENGEKTRSPKFQIFLNVRSAGD